MPLIRSATPADIPAMLQIEQSANSHPWSEGTFNTCFSERYFNAVLLDDDDEVSDDVKAWQNHADIDEKMARLVEKLQDWREKNAKAPYEVWNEKDKGDFDVSDLVTLLFHPVCSIMWLTKSIRIYRKSTHRNGCMIMLIL